MLTVTPTSRLSIMYLPTKHKDGKAMVQFPHKKATGRSQGRQGNTSWGSRHCQRVVFAAVVLERALSHSRSDGATCRGDPISVSLTVLYTIPE